jgi:hypothetical protein
MTLAYLESFVTQEKVLAVPGFGRINSQPLLQWASECARGFVYNTQQTAADRMESEPPGVVVGQAVSSGDALDTPSAGVRVQFTDKSHTRAVVPLVDFVASQPKPHPPDQSDAPVFTSRQGDGSGSINPCAAI